MTVGHMRLMRPLAPTPAKASTCLASFPKGGLAGHNRGIMSGMSWLAMGRPFVIGRLRTWLAGYIFYNPTRNIFLDVENSFSAKRGEGEGKQREKRGKG